MLFVYYVFQDAGISLRIDTELVPKIDTIVREGVKDTREMKRLFKIIAKTDIFKNEISLNQLTKDISHEPLLYAIMLLMQKETYVTL